MTPRILFIGAAHGQGSWDVRGRQIGAVLNAKVTQKPVMADWRWADVVILVKHAIDEWGATAKRCNLPLIWDVLDYWQQPEENERTVEDYRQVIAKRASQCGIGALIGATRQMAEDIGGVYIPHHSRPGLKATPPREKARIVAYEGTRKYLGRWLDALEAACAERGLGMEINPPSLANADVVVSLRWGKWDGPLCHDWKSGVKYVNALVAGKPVIAQPCSALTEIDPVGVTVPSMDQIGWAIDSAVGLRHEAYALAKQRRQEFAIETIAAQYRVLALTALKVAA
jgi:hypothetical protein